MKKFYVASSFKNVANVRYVAQGLENEGYINTYDWTLNAKARDEKTVTLSDLKKIGQMEKEAVLDADVVVILLPGGKGTHIELGIAIGQAKKIFLHSPDGTVNHVETTSTFWLS